MRICLKPIRNLLHFLLAFALILPAELLPGQTQPMPTELNLVVVEGEGSIINVRQRVSRDPVVRVEDENHKPIVGAVVVFTLPTEGATGEFGNGSKTLTVMSDSQGLAKAQGLKVNQGGGKLPIHVTASFRSLTARTTLTQFVEVPPGTKVSTRHGGSGKVIAILAVIGAAAAGGAVYATQRSKSGTVVNPPPAGPAAIGITAGNGTIAPPH